MKYAVAYYSKSGNTKKMADAVAGVLEVTAQDVSVALKEKADILFLGSSTYAGGFDPSVGTFIRENAEKIGTIVCFGSSASGKTTAGKVKKLADELGIPVYKKSFGCSGHFLFMHKNHPDDTDIAALKEFVSVAVNDLN